MIKYLFLYFLLIYYAVNLNAQSAGDYRTKQNGTWGIAANWERYDGTSWVAATIAPNSSNGEITVQHAMTIGTNITLDQVVVTSSGSIGVSGTPTITIADGTGVDLLNNGTINFANCPFVLNGQMMNNATITSTTGLLTVGATTGSLTNASTGIMNIGPLTNNNSIINHGTITTNGAVNSSAASSAITNNGTWNINSTFTLNNATSNFTNSASGTLNVNTSGSITLTNGNITNNGTITNNNTITLNGGTFTNSGTVNNYATIINNLVTLTLTSPITNHINSIFRYSRNGNQTVYEILYYHLEIGGSAATNTKTLTLTNNYNISGNLTLLPVALNCVFEIIGASPYVFSVSGIISIGANAKLQPAGNIVVNGLGSPISIANFGEIRVTNNTSSTPLSTQYQNFSWASVADSGIVNYFANGTQTIQQTLPDGSNYGSLYITSVGVALNKNLTIAGTQVVRGNLIVNSVTGGSLLELHGTGTLQIGGRLDVTNNGLIDVLPTVTIQATGTNSYMNVGANTQIRITQSQFTNQFQSFKYVSCNATSTQIFYSNNAQLVEALPTDGPLRPYGYVRLVGDRDANDITFQPTNIAMIALIDSSTFTTGNLNFTNSTIIFANTGLVNSRSFKRENFQFYNLTISSAQHRFSTPVVVNNDLIIGSNAFISFDFFNYNTPFAITVLGNATFTQTSTPLASPKIGFILYRVNGAKFKNLTLTGDAAMTAVGYLTGLGFYAKVYFESNVINNNSHSSTLLTGNNTTAFFISESPTYQTIGGSYQVVLSDSAKMKGNWKLTNHLVFNSSTPVDFVLNYANLDLDTYNLVAIGTTHNLDYLPSNVTMPPATDPFCTHSQVINWNCVRAETIYVATTGNNANNGLTPATAVRDMRVAVRKVSHGGVIMVANGTYTEIFDVKKKVKIHGESNTGTIFEAPTGLSAPSPTCAVSQQNDSAIVYFNYYSDSSYLYNVRISHNASRIRRGIVIGGDVKGIIIENNNINGTYDAGTFGIPVNPGYQDCPTSYGANINNRTYNLQALSNATFDIRNNSFVGFGHRTIGTFESGDKFGMSLIRNNTINNNSSWSIGRQGIWLYDSHNIAIENNNIACTSSSLDFSLDISNFKKGGNYPSQIIVRNNTINSTATATAQCQVIDASNEGKVIFENNTITTRSGSRGILVKTSRDVDILNNTFHAVSNSFTHIDLDNFTYFAYPVGVNIFGNTFNSFTSFGGTAIRALKTDPITGYAKLNLNGAPLYNTFTVNTKFFLDLTETLGPNADTIDMTDGNIFPFSPTFDYYRVEERIVHRMDDARGASGASYPRPIVFVVPRNYFVCNENEPGWVIPIDNRSIQDGIDFAAPHDTVNIQFGTFSYPTATEFENTVNFNKPLSFRANNNGGTPTVDRNFAVNLPTAADSVTQFNNFNFSDGFIQPLNFTVNQGDWVLNGGVITFANANATLVEALNNTIRGYTGWIQTTRNIGAPTSLNVAGFGAELTSSVNMGTTTIRRGHWEQTVPVGRSILRVFNIQPTTNTGLNATFRFRYDPSELVAGQDAADLQQYRNANNFSPWHNGYNIVPYVLQGGTAGTNFVDLSGINAFSSWTLADPTILPVELLSFNATLVNQNAVRLDWNVANEVNLSHYEVEKSYDLASFFKLGNNVTAEGLPAYRSWDYEPKFGVNYYRLRMVDYDGSYKFSEIRTVVLDSVNQLSLLVYPNPFNDNLQISLSGVDNQPCEITITDAIGRTVYTQFVSEWKGNVTVDLSKLSSGVYYLKVQAGDNSIGTKLVKN